LLFRELTAIKVSNNRENCYRKVGVICVIFVIMLWFESYSIQFTRPETLLCGKQDSYKKQNKIHLFLTDVKKPVFVLVGEKVQLKDLL
jgi:hypothetical protein